MAVDDLALALIDLHDPAIRDQIASGDFSGLSSSELSAEERDLVVAASVDEPEVEAFDIMASRYYPSLTYIANNRDQLTPVVRQDFNAFFRNRYGSKWTLALMG